MKYGLIGEKLGHSFSKPLHEQLAGYTYEITEIAREDIDKFFTKADFEAINVTIPYKEIALSHMDATEPLAKEVGAVNTVVNRGGKLYGYNTDVYGMTELFRHAKIDPEGKKVAILGTGGTSKTARVCLGILGAGEVIRVSRTAKADAVTYDELYEKHGDVDIIVNTTPVGTYPNVNNSPIDISRFPELSGVIDAVYNPLRTELVSEALSMGIRAEGGLYMLAAQAVRASEIFIDTKYPNGTVDEIYAKLLSQKENIVLVGMPSSGKSTVGKYISERLGRELVDTDGIITENEGTDIPTIFRERGERGFRDAEAKAVSAAAKETSRIIATGGGAILRPENVRALKRCGRIYFIDRPLEQLIPTSSRPLASDRAALEQRYRERYPIYTSVCDVRIDGSGSIEDVAERIIKEFCK